MGKTVLEASQVSNKNGLDNFEKQAVVEKEACAADAKTLKASLQEAVSKRYSLEKTNESTGLLKTRKEDYAKSLEAEVGGYTAFLGDIKKGQEAWTSFYESMANEIRANLEYRFYDTLGMKPILTGLVEVAAKGISTDQFYKISHTMDLIDNFLADRNNNLIEDNEYENTLNASLTNSINDSVTSTKSELEIVNGLIGSLDTRMGLLGTAVQNAVALSTYARNVLEARVAICADFAKTYFNHVRRYNSVRLTIAELSNTFDEEYKDFESFLQKKMSESN